MNLGSLLSAHLHIVLFGVTLLASMGVPLPVSVTLLVAGAAAHGGHDQLALVIALAWVAALTGDTLLYLGGRYTGWWLLGRLCRLTTNPEQCIFHSADYFYRRGPRILLFAKFIPGLGVMAAPLAGSLNMRIVRFLRLDSLGALFYATAWVSTGFIFFRYIDAIEAWVARAGHVVITTALLFALLYALGWLIFSLRARRFRGIVRVEPDDLQSRLQTTDPNKLVIIADVRSHGYYDPGMQRIKNSIRVEPHRLEEELVALRDFMAPECEIYLYCSCIREATSVRVAYLLNQQNCDTKVISGGLRGWIRAGGEVEPVPAHEIEHLPRFE